MLMRWVFILLFVGVFGSGFFVAWWIKDMQVKSKDVELQKKQAELVANINALNDCKEANDTTQKTIILLKEQIKKEQDLCSKRLAANKRLIEQLRHIDSFKKGFSDEKSIDNDPILVELNRMFFEADSKD